jgi:heme-degrading monooxygenase HmoA
MLIDVTAFGLADGADVAAFLAADYRVQTEFANPQPGFVRRTTARSDNNQWLVLTFWASDSAADEADAAAASHPAVQAFTGLVDPATIRSKRYRTID